MRSKRPWGWEVIRRQAGSGGIRGRRGRGGVGGDKGQCRGHGFWRRGTTTIFDIHIVNFDAGYYLHMAPGKDIAKA